MSIYDHLTEFGGLPVVDFERPAARAEPPPAGSVAWRIRTGFEGSDFDELFADFVATVDTKAVTSVVIGYWGASYDSAVADPVALLAAAADRLPDLRAVFLGDIVSEEQEISWIEHSDLTPLFTAFPLLERVEVRGGVGLRLEPIASEALRVLRFEAGGLPAGLVRGVAASDLPRLERLELWLGIDTYRGDVTIADLAPILSGDRLPGLRHLALANSEIQDEIAAAVASAPVVARLETLDLSMGTLTDKGAGALLSGQSLTHLRRLDLAHHFLTTPMIERVRASLPGVEVDLGDQRSAESFTDTRPDGTTRYEEWLYVAVSE